MDIDIHKAVKEFIFDNKQKSLEIVFTYFSGLVTFDILPERLKSNRTFWTVFLQKNESSQIISFYFNDGPKVKAIILVEVSNIIFENDSININRFYSTDKNNIYPEKIEISPLIFYLYFWVGSFENSPLSYKSAISHSYSDAIKVKTYQGNLDAVLKNHKSSNCYVATLVYEDIEHPQVQFLRNYRDEVLFKSLVGRWFISKYYKLSPEFVYYLKPFKLPQIIIKKILNLIILFVK